MAERSAPVILNVDDAEVARYTKTRTLRHAGFSVVEAADGRQALEMVEQKLPALVLLDVRLPDISGIQVCKIIKQRWPATMVLQTSATFVSSADRTRGLEGGADSYLIQPIDADELVAAIRALLRLHAAEENARLLNESLERRIIERTRDLHEANAALTQQIEQRERAERALVQAQKLDAIGQLTGVIAHDFNNMLAAVTNYLHLIHRRADDAKLKSLTEQAKLVVHRGSKLTARLLSFARTAPLRHEAVDVEELVRGMEDWLAQSTGESVSLEVVCTAQEPVALTDANQLELAVLNLVINSRDAMPRGGSIKIGISRRSIETAEPDLSAGEYIVVDVTDSGEGMDPETAARAFEAFYTTKPAGRGTGLGLSQVHDLAVQSKGAARLNSWPGQGTSVELWLQAGQGQAIPMLYADGGPPGDGFSVLVVDDDVDVLSTMSNILTGHGYSVGTATGGEEALRLLEDQRPDALVLDVSMPGLSGLDVARRIRQRGGALPIVFVSGDAGLQTPLADGRTLLVRKPFQPDRLLSAVARSVRGKEI